MSDGHGVSRTWEPVERGGLLKAGHDRGFGDRRVRRGEWVRVGPSVYLPKQAQLRDRIDAALLHAGPGAVVTGWAACELWGMPYVEPRRAVDVLVPARRRRVSTPYVRVLPTTRPPVGLPGPWGLPLAAPTRAVVDAARALTGLRDVRALVLGAARWTSAPELREELGAGSRGGRALVARAITDLEAGAASAPEAEVADWASLAVRQGRFPPFLLNPEVWVDGVLLGIPDGWVPGLAMGWEQDSKEFHALDQASQRVDRFASYGLLLLGLTPGRTRAMGPGVADLLAGTAATRRRDLAAEPPGLVVRATGPLLPLRAGGPPASPSRGRRSASARSGSA